MSADQSIQKQCIFENKEIMLFSHMKSRSFESAIKAFTDLQISTHQLPFQRALTGDSVNVEIKFPVSDSVVFCLQPGMDKENLERFHPEFCFIILVSILTGLASAVRYIQVDGKGSSSRSRILKLEEEIRNCKEVLREYQASLIGLSEEVERLKQPNSPCDLERKQLCCLMSEYEKRGDEMVEQVDRVQSHTDQHDHSLAHTPAGIHREPSLDVLKPSTTHIVEVGRAKLVYIEKPKTPSEEDIHTATRLHIQKHIYKPKVLNLRERRSDKHTQGSVNPSSMGDRGWSK